MLLDSHDIPTLTFRRQALDHVIPFVKTAAEIRVHFTSALASLASVGSLDFYLDPIVEELPHEAAGATRRAGMESDPFFPSCLLSRMSGSDQMWFLDEERAVIIPIHHLASPVEVDKFGKFTQIDGDYLYWEGDVYRQVIAHWNLGVAFSMEKIFGSGENGRVSSGQIHEYLKQCLPSSK